MFLNFCMQRMNFAQFKATVLCQDCLQLLASCSMLPIIFKPAWPPFPSFSLITADSSNYQLPTSTLCSAILCHVDGVLCINKYFDQPHHDYRGSTPAHDSDSLASCTHFNLHHIIHQYQQGRGGRGVALLRPPLEVEVGHSEGGTFLHLMQIKSLKS